MMEKHLARILDGLLNCENQWFVRTRAQRFNEPVIAQTETKLGPLRTTGVWDNGLPCLC